MMYKKNQNLTFHYVIDHSTTTDLQHKNTISSYTYPSLNIIPNGTVIIAWCEMEDLLILKSCTSCIQENFVQVEKCFFILIFFKQKK